MEFFAAVKNNVAGTLKNTIDKSKWNSKIYSSKPEEREKENKKQKTKDRKNKSQTEALTYQYFQLTINSINTLIKTQFDKVNKRLIK